MACILEKNNTKIYISYAPGTGSTSLEQFLRTYEHVLLYQNFNVKHFPSAEFGIDSSLSRHICYKDYLGQTGDVCNQILTAVRHPFEYYYAEFSRILTKWSILLDDDTSWIYKPESKSTLELTLKAKNAKSFDEWLYSILKSQISLNYMVINGDHMENATHFMKCETLENDFHLIFSEIFLEDLKDQFGPFPFVNKTDYKSTYKNFVSEETLNLGNHLFRKYLNKFNYIL
jgi:hypothetical protein